MLHNVVLLLAATIITTKAQDFKVPPLDFEIFTPRGFRASLPHQENLHQVNIHINKNKPIEVTDAGEYSSSIESSENGRWTYDNKDAELVRGDRLYYWVFVQYENLGFYSKDQFEVTEIISESDNGDNTACEESVTRIPGRVKICENSVILEDDFSSLHRDKWKVEHLIPFDGPSGNHPDAEFVSYQNNDQVCYTKNGKLFIKPTIQNNVYGRLNMTVGCTGTFEDECYQAKQGVLILPPVIAGRLVSMDQYGFTYGRIEILAKLPLGDWLYPQLRLESVTDPSRRLYVAYARGNVQLSDDSGKEYGAKVLYGGLALIPSEPDRSRQIVSTTSKVPFGDDFHNYTAIWTPRKITVIVDDEEYGQINAIFPDKCRLVLGVGAGGINDFPDDVHSGDTKKPWINSDRGQVYQFFNDKSNWYATWNEDSSALQVDSVKIYAL